MGEHFEGIALCWSDRHDEARAEYKKALSDAVTPEIWPTPNATVESPGDKSDRRVVARETIELTLEIRENDIYEFWAMTDEYPHFHASSEGFDAIRRALVDDPRTVLDGRGILTLRDQTQSTTADQGARKP